MLQYLNNPMPLLSGLKWEWLVIRRRNCSVELHTDVEAVRIEAARIATGATKLCNGQSLLSELKWERLVIRRRNHLFFIKWICSTVSK